MFSRNHRIRKVKVRAQFVRGPRSAGMVARCQDSAAGRAGPLFETGNIVTLPTMYRDRYRLQTCDGQFGVNSPFSGKLIWRCRSLSLFVPSNTPRADDRVACAEARSCDLAPANQRRARSGNFGNIVPVWHTCRKRAFIDALSADSDCGCDVGDDQAFRLRAGHRRQAARNLQLIQMQPWETTRFLGVEIAPRALDPRDIVILLGQRTRFGDSCRRPATSEAGHSPVGTGIFRRWCNDSDSLMLLDLPP